MYQDQDNAVASENQEASCQNTGIKGQLELLDQFKLLKAAALDPRLSSTAKAVFAIIVDGVDKKTGFYFVGRGTLSQKTGKDHKTVRNAIKSLEERRWLKVEVRRVPAKDRQSSDHSSWNLPNRYWPNFARLEEQAAAPKVESGKVEKRQATKATQPAPAPAATPPAPKPKPKPVAAVVVALAPAVDLSGLKHIKKPTKRALRLWGMEYTNIADELPAILLELDDEAGKRSKHLRMKFIRDEFSKRNQKANTMAKAA